MSARWPRRAVPALPPTVALSHASSSETVGATTERTIAAWMKDWQLPIGVYVGSEPEGRMVAQICYNRGWRVPEDVAIIAGRNEETFCEHLHPTLTSVELGYERIGYEAARLLDRLMDGEVAAGNDRSCFRRKASSSASQPISSPSTTS